MEPEGSAPHSQQPATCPCLEPDRSSPCPNPCTIQIKQKIGPYNRSWEDKHLLTYQDSKSELPNP